MPHYQKPGIFKIYKTFPHILVSHKWLACLSNSGQVLMTVCQHQPSCCNISQSLNCWPPSLCSRCSLHLEWTA